MRIGELATQVGCDVQTIRFYEREGLLDEPRREPSGYRAYATEHRERLQFIRHCRSLDIPLPEIRTLIDFAAAPERSCAQVNALLDGHITTVQAKLAALKALEQQLLSLRQQCDGDPSQSCAILQSFMTATGEHACACHPASAITTTLPPPVPPPR
jgi:Cd(II)/Pb(II)-responsive transcriptional regulator